MADPYFRPRRIAFAGSSRKLRPYEDQYCRTLGRVLARETQDVLVTAGFKQAPNDKGFASDWYFVEGAKEALGSPQEIDARIITRRHEKDTTTENGKAKVGRFSEGQVINTAQPLNELRRFEMAHEADAVIATHGSEGGGTAQIAHFAIATRTPLLPIPCYGGGVGVLWSKYRDVFADALGLDSATQARWETRPTSDAAACHLAEEMALHFHATLSRACFVIMPFADAMRPLYHDVIAPAVEGMGDRLRRLDVLGLAGDVLAQIKEGIRTADYCVAVLDDLKPNILYEIGMAHALDKPVILMNTRGRIGEQTPFDIGHHQRIEFEPGDKQLAQRLQDAIVEVRRDAFL